MRFLGFLFSSFLAYLFCMGMIYFRQDITNFWLYILGYPLAILLCVGGLRLPIFKDYYNNAEQVIEQPIFNGKNSWANQRASAPAMMITITRIESLLLWLIYRGDTSGVAFCGGVSASILAIYFDPNF